MSLPRGRSDEQDQRREFVRDLLRERATVTVNDAWEAGHKAGIYVGGDGPVVKDDLNAVGTRHDGYWRHTNDERRRRSCIRWADYWTRRGSRASL